ncbi:hypothetical protein NEUTE1DRAFT_101519 [Neurospora tetrasperma FGSC 2508]|uniref:Uncharacterized protein n=1 Tax=Neurospora tetrasperma (strain FGSC 2508 / ATCC MYA-4615 / P0657) TaxID=510951 RepID=F8MP23_NEUT8|nr:uncharacterized protein NEUTE1DRAFT_101519 [Neurospora tetrasperma FGSC 2508]EGO56242.1 hypothetical protein NEUTE1DRAFT_101519 [Neurospora tetrasperma FGSC 2508]
MACVVGSAPLADVGQRWEIRRRPFKMLATTDVAGRLNQGGASGYGGGQPCPATAPVGLPAAVAVTVSDGWAR